MKGRFVRLKNEWLLRGWTDLPFALLNWRNGARIKLDPGASDLVIACDGKNDFQSSQLSRRDQTFIEKLSEKGIIEVLPEPRPIESFQRYRQADNPCLLFLHWGVTGLCNLNCKHCNFEAPSGRYGELSFEKMASLIDQFVEANVLEVSLTGGEPLLRKDLLQIISRLKDKKIFVNEILTNGVLVTIEFLNHLRQLDVFPRFQVSFDGCGAHDRMRGVEGTEGRAIEAIELLREMGFLVDIATSVDRRNMDTIDETFDLLRRLGIDFWRMGPPQKTGNWRQTDTEISLDEEAKIYSGLLERWLQADRPFGLQLGGFFNSIKQQIEAFSAGQEGVYSPESYDCIACRDRACLLPDGTLLPCGLYVDTFVQKSMPNLLKENLSQVWTESSLRSLMEVRKKDLLDENEECVTCGHFKNCGLGCRALAVSESNDLKAKDPIGCALWNSGYPQEFHRHAYEYLREKRT